MHKTAPDVMDRGLTEVTGSTTQHLKTDSTEIVYGQVCAVVWPHYSTLGYVTGFGLGEPLQ